MDYAYRCGIPERELKVLLFAAGLLLIAAGIPERELKAPWSGGTSWVRGRNPGKGVESDMESIADEIGVIENPGKGVESSCTYLISTSSRFFRNPGKGVERASQVPMASI